MRIMLNDDASRTNPQGTQEDVGNAVSESTTLSTQTKKTIGPQGQNCL
jgi:hypothetical protein